MRYITLLRGINVGGHRKIKMADLREKLAVLGFSNLQTYIQSGNIVFDSEEENAQKLEKEIAQLIKDQYGFDVPVIIRTKEALEAVAKQNPFLAEQPDLDITKIAVAFLSTKPADEHIQAISPCPYPPEEFRIIGRELYLHCPNGFAKSKLTNNFFEKKLKVTATTRNWKTVNKLVELSTYRRL